MRSDSKQMCMFASIIAVPVLSIAFALAYTSEKPVDVVVLRHTWQWEIKVEQFKPVRHEHESGDAPAGAYNVYEWTETRVDEDGFRRHWDYCSYTMDEWAYDRSLITGNQDKTPFTPDTSSVKISDRLQPILGDERISDRIQTFKLYLVKGNYSFWEYETDLDTWLAVDDGEIHRLFVNAFGQIRRFEKLEQTDRMPE